MIVKLEDYFDCSEFPYADIFEGIDELWNVLKKISAYSKDTLITGEQCTIAPSAHIRGGVILGNNVTIGHAVELKNCIVMNNSAIAHLNYVGDSIIGSNVNVAGGALCANFRLDKQPVRVKFPDHTIDTHLEKFSAIIGDNSSIGANAVLNPGTILGKNSRVYPLTSVVGVYPSDSIIK